jgi:hypothetical protein
MRKNVLRQNVHGNMSAGGVVHGANCLWDQMSTGQNVHKQNVHGAKYP